MTIIIFTLLAIIIYLAFHCTSHPFSTQHPLQLMPPRPICSTQIAGRRRQDDGTTATLNPPKEKAPEITNGPNATTENTSMEVEDNWPPLTLAVVSPPSAPNLTLLLTGHTCQEDGPQTTDKDNAADNTIQPQEKNQANDMAKAPSKKKPKKLKNHKRRHIDEARP